MAELNSPKGESSTMSPRKGRVPLETVLRTEELNRRPRRPPDYESENRALAALVQALADSPQTILQTLAEKILEVFRVGSAGITLLTLHDGGKDFYWPAIAGACKSNIGGSMPRDSSPCGVVIDRNAVQLFARPERHYHYLVSIAAPIVEALLAPIYVKRKPVGTIWAIAHDDCRKFDLEDLRLLESLSRFASAAYQAVVELQRNQDSRRAALNLIEDARQSRQLAENLNRELRNEVAERRKAEEELRQADRHKNEFLAMLAHELRNPLAPIQNAVTILRAKNASESQFEWCRDVIERQVKQLARLMDDLFDIARIARDQLQIRKERVELEKIIENAIEGSRPQIEAAEHKLTVTVSGQIWLDADPTRLAQVFSNLLNNAAKYTTNHGEIWLAAERQGSEAVITVKDTGIGMSKEFLPHAFEMFTQGERCREGLGLGLSLARRIVEIHDGTIDAKSEGRGRGSEFVVRLPAADPPVGISDAASSDLETVRHRQIKRVLVVDDSHLQARTLAMFLELNGYEVQTAPDGPSTLQMLSEFAPDVALIDIGLPGMNGNELARRICEQFATAPVLIAQTGWGRDEDRRKSEQAGFEYHLVKPVQPEEIVKLLRKLEVSTPPSHPKAKVHADTGG